VIIASSGIDGLIFTASANGLRVYLDNWAVIELAKHDSPRRARFVAAICKGGDLLFSSTNAAELIGPKGQSFEAVKVFLDQLGPHWIPVELNPFKVKERERNGMGLESCISKDFMTAYFRNRVARCTPGSGEIIDMSDNFFKLSSVVDWVAQDKSIRKKSEEFDDLLKGIRERQVEYERNQSRAVQQVRAFNPLTPATFACDNLIRTLIVESKAYSVEPGDGFDFCHAVIGSAFAHVATLDKNWKRRVENLPQPNGLARIYYRPELDTMVADIELQVERRESEERRS
jgi:hypothetical protein